jgi:hypothetical protein
MKIFNITIRTATATTRYSAIAQSSISAYMAAVDAQGDAACSISVIRA